MHECCVCFAWEEIALGRPADRSARATILWLDELVSCRFPMRVIYSCEESTVFNFEIRVQFKYMVVSINYAVLFSTKPSFSLC